MLWCMMKHARSSLLTILGCTVQWGETLSEGPSVIIYDRETRSEKLKVACSLEGASERFDRGKSSALDQLRRCLEKTKQIFLSYLPLRGLTRLSIASALRRESKFQLWNKSVFYQSLKMQHAILFIQLRNNSSNCSWFGSGNFSQILPVKKDTSWKQRATSSPPESFVKPREQTRQAESPFSITVSAVVYLFIKLKMWDQRIKKFILSLSYLP